MSFLSNLPTLVLGISVMKVHWSGSHQRGTRPAKKSTRSDGDGVRPGLGTTATRGRSDHFGSGTAMTVASKTSGCAMTAFSSSTEEIHSPPDLITSLVRSEIVMYPWRSSVPTSPVHSQPSWNFEGSSSL